MLEAVDEVLHSVRVRVRVRARVGVRVRPLTLTLTLTRWSIRTYSCTSLASHPSYGQRCGRALSFHPYPNPNPNPDPNQVRQTWAQANPTPTRTPNQVRQSWARRDSDFIGRFDLLWDGESEPKLAEYNADTPTVLVRLRLRVRVKP